MLKYLLECNVRNCRNRTEETVVKGKSRLTTLPIGWIRIGVFNEDDVNDVHLCPKHAELLQVNE